MSKKTQFVEVETQFSLSRAQVLSLYTLLTTAVTVLRRVDEDLADEIRKSSSFEMFEDFLSTPTSPMDPVVRSIERSIRKAADLAFDKPRKSKASRPVVDEKTFASAVLAEGEDRKHLIEELAEKEPT